MNPLELVERDLQRDEANTSVSVSELSDRCPFSRHRLFVVSGATRRFDFPTLPGGSRGYYVANGESATRLTREGKEIESVLSAEWDHLSSADPVLLASLILNFYDGGIRATHYVIRDLDALLNFGDAQRPTRDYKLNEKQLSQAVPRIGSTSSRQDADVLAIRAVTLCGWMHDKRNLGIESFTVNPEGHPSFAKREVLSRKIFTHVPMLRY